MLCLHKKALSMVHSLIGNNIVAKLGKQESDKSQTETIGIGTMLYNILLSYQIRVIERLVYLYRNGCS